MLRRACFLLVTGLALLPCSAMAQAITTDSTLDLPTSPDDSGESAFYVADMKYVCVGDPAALEMHVDMTSSRDTNFELELRGASLNGLKNGAKISFKADRPARGTLSMCVKGGSCLPVDGKLLVLNLEVPGYLKGVITWSVERGLPPVVVPFEAKLPEGTDVAPCRPAAATADDSAVPLPAPESAPQPEPAPQPVQ